MSPAANGQLVPARLLWDNESGIGRARPTEPVVAFAVADVRVRARHPVLTDPAQVRDQSTYGEVLGIDLGQQPLTSGGGFTTERPSRIEYYARAVRAPRISDAFRQLGDQVRDAGWSHEE